MKFVSEENYRNQQGDCAEQLICEGRQRLGQWQRFERKDHALHQIRVSDNCSGRNYQRLLKHVPWQQSAKEIDRVIPLRDAVAKARLENSGKDERENRDQDYRGQQRPCYAERRTLVASQQLSA